MSCACGNKFPRARVRIRKPPEGTRCSLCCCRRVAFIEQRDGGITVPLCKGCLERMLDHYHELLTNEAHSQRQQARAAGWDPQ